MPCSSKCFKVVCRVRRTRSFAKSWWRFASIALESKKVYAVKSSAASLEEQERGNSQTRV